jgi:transcriptional regulator
MYVPRNFTEDRVPVLHELIRRHSLATLVTLSPAGLCADHIPMEIEPGPGPYGTLQGHVSRSNPVWQTARRDVETLAIFQGVQGYVTPAWYPSKQDGGKVVPTWNYAVVHAYGPLRVIEDPVWLRRLVTRLTERHESGRREPWRVTDAPEDYLERQLKGIVGLEIPVTRLEGKWKMSQNRALPDRAGVIAGLREQGDPASLALADLVAGTTHDAGSSGGAGGASTTA